MSVDFAAAVPVSSTQSERRIIEPLDCVLTTRSSLRWHLAISSVSYFRRTSGLVRSERFSHSVGAASIVSIGTRSMRGPLAAPFKVGSRRSSYSVDTASVHRRLAVRAAAVGTTAILCGCDAVWTTSKRAAFACDSRWYRRRVGHCRQQRRLGSCRCGPIGTTGSSRTKCRSDTVRTTTVFQKVARDG